MRTLLLSSLLLLGLSAHAEYYVYLTNNTPETVQVQNTCNTPNSNACRFHSGSEIKAFERIQSFSLSYNRGMTAGKEFTEVSRVTAGDGEQYYFKITFVGDSVGSHIKSIDFLQNGNMHVLLNSDNSSGKVLPGVVGKYAFKDKQGGNPLVAYVSAQHDIATLQGIDSIYMTLDKPYQTFSSQGDKSKLSVMTYNIQAFPNYFSVGLDLNKMDTRMTYLANQARIRNFDVILFEEAWARNARDILRQGLLKDYPYSLDPVPVHDYSKPLYSGLLVFSKYPIAKSYFLNYQDYQSLTDADKFSNKGALFFRIDKQGVPINFVVTHTQAQNDPKAIQVRQEEFRLIKDKIIDNSNLGISPNQYFFVMGDMNADLYASAEFDYMAKTLNLNTSWVNNSFFAEPKFSYDSNLNIMISPSTHEQGMYDYVVPVAGFMQPSQGFFQVTPIRALDNPKMYARSAGPILYHYGDIELSDHFMAQAQFILQPGGRLEWVLDMSLHPFNLKTRDGRNENGS